MSWPNKRYNRFLRPSNERHSMHARTVLALPGLLLTLSYAAGAFAAPACGAAPTGELRAERVASVKPSHKEPGLYEGPVWIGDALYFSDFTFAPGFPSRIRKLAADGTVTTVVEDSGSNGLAVDAHGDLVAATHKYKA